MDAGVPFALLAAAQLMAVAALLALVPAVFGTALQTGLRSSFVAATGAITAAVGNALTGARLGTDNSDVLLVVQAAGLAVLGVGLALGSPARPSTVAKRDTAGLFTIAPLGAAIPAGAGSAAGGLLAAAGAWRRNAPGRRFLSSGLFLFGIAGALAAGARTHVGAADALLAIRTAGALCVLAALAILARTSVLSKIVYLLGVGITLTAVAIAGVVGTVVANRLSADQARQLRTAAVGAATDLQNDAATAQQLATLAAGCSTDIAAITTCAASVARFASGNAFTAVAAPGKAVEVVGGTLVLDRASLLDLQQQDAVREALANPGFVGSGFVLLRGAPERLFALGIASHRDPAHPTAAPPIVVIYGAAVDQARLTRTRARSTFDATVLAALDGAPIASSLPTYSAASVGHEAERQRLFARLPAAGRAISRFGAGSSPSAGYVALDNGSEVVAALALSAPNDTVLHTQQLVLELLFSALLAIGLAVGSAAIVVGRRAVDPVLRLTATARAVGAGDLDARPDVRAVDEVGQLARVFGRMTASLQTMTDDLRDTADAEAATRARLATVLDALSDALVVSDANGLITVTNPAARGLLGDVVGLPVTAALIGPDGRALQQGEGLLAQPGNAIPVAVSRAPLPEGQGAVHLLRDVTAARQLEQAKTEFLANASHELRAPLTPILGYADLLSRHPDLSRDKIGAMADSIAASTRRMSRVVNLLVDVAALDAGRIQAAPEEIDVGAFAASRLADWRVRFPARAHDLGRRVAGGLPAVLADRALLVRAIDELLDNALKYTEVGTGVVIRAASAEPGRVRLSVHDTGPGLDPMQRDALMSTFAQADASATRAHEGLGLGLAFVARVAAVLGGTLLVRSEPGQGATFTLDVPAAEPPGPGRPNDAGPDSPTRTYRRAAKPDSVSGTGRAKAARRRGGPTA